MKNLKFKEILETYKNKSNKELSEILLLLNNDFQTIKTVLLELTETMGEVEEVYDKVYIELQKRLKFKDNDE